MPYPDSGFRLLTLFRYWNIIEYYFPYKHLTSTNWDMVLGNYLNLFVTAQNEFDYEMTTLKLIGEVGDTHANLWGGNNAIENWKGNFYPPFHVRFIEEQPVVVDYYNPELREASQLAIGDVITKINGKDIASILEERASYYPASNYPTQLRDIGEELLRSKDSTISISYTNNGKLKGHVLKLYPKNQLNTYRWYKRKPDELSYKWLAGNIGYITLQNIKEQDIEPIKEKFKDADGIVIDIRNYPSFFVPFALGQYFINEFTPFARFTEANQKNPGVFVMNSGVKIPPKGKQYKGNLVVLVNELSQSQAEYTAMAFRATPNCTIVGSTTAGADGNVSSISLPGGMSTSISGIGVHYPDGSETQRIGIVPDVVVKPTIQGIKEGRDELLEKAIEIINSN
jgi:C-terminal processing protease CtpA/Prc